MKHWATSKGSPAGEPAPAPRTWSGTRTSALPEPGPGGGGSPTGDDTLTVAELAQCDLSTSDQFGQALVQQNLLWAIEQQWIDSFWPAGPPPARPDFSGDTDRMTTVDGDCEWYNQRFAPAYLALGLNAAEQGGFSTKLTPAQALQLEYYLNVAIGLDIAYTRQTQGVAVSAALQASPTLARYQSDDPATWAAALYAYVTLPANLNSLVAQIQTGTEGGVRQLEDYATMLTVLDPSGSYAQQFYDAVTGAVTVAISIQADPSLDPDLPQWLPDYIQQYIAATYTDKTRPGDPGGQAAFDVGAALQDGITAAGDIDQLVTGIIAAVKRLSAVNPVNLGPRAQALATTLSDALNWPQAKTAAASLLMAGGLYCSIKAIGNWESLDGPAQANTVLNLVAMMQTAITGLPDVASFAAWTVSSFGNAVVLAYMKANSIATLMEAFAALSDNVFITFVAWLSSSFDRAGKVLTTAGTALGTLFTGADVLIKAIAPVLSAAAFGLSIWTLVHDIAAGAGAVNIAFDAAQTALAGVVVVCAALEFVPGVDVVTTIIGAAAALAGALVAFAQYLFNYFTEPENPADQYLDQVVLPLVAALAAEFPVPAGWTPAVVVTAT